MPPQNKSTWFPVFKIVPILIKGRLKAGLVMQRKTGGKYEYRLPDAEEEADYVSREAW